MLRPTISIILHVLAGFFIYGVCLIAFAGGQDVGSHKYTIMAIFAVPALILLPIAVAVYRFQGWKSSVGITFLSVAAFNLIAILTFACLFLDPEFVKLFPDKNPLEMFNDYFSGTVVMIVVTITGGLLYISERRESKA
ncbi:MAG: hypothetical protein JXA04_05560 [Gammaproteobacteria bacterium]|nr:hypothetical protein [Gammaproteobacteria bacterium]